MEVNFNSNIKLLNGGSYCGGTAWNKQANDIDKCYKLYILRTGKAELYSDNEVFTIDGPNIYLINGYAIDSQNCKEKIIVDWVHFLPESVYFNHILRSTPCVSLLDASHFSSFSELYKQFNPLFLGRLSREDAYVSKIEIQSFIQLALAKVFSSVDHRYLDRDNDIHRLVPTLEYIAQNYTSEIELKDLADICFLSPNYFHRLFCQKFDLTPLKYIRQIRMEEAIRQLVYTNKTVKEVAFAVGYDDEAYFSRIFSKVYCCSPGKYRAHNKTKLP